jgi:hypothetical protein
MLVIAGSLCFLYNVPTIQIKKAKATEEKTPIKIHEFSLGTSVEEIPGICKNQKKFLKKFHTEKLNTEVYRCYIPGNMLDMSFIKYSNYGPVYINIETDGKKVTSLGYVYSSKKLFRIIRSDFESRYKKYRLSDQFTDRGTKVVSYQSPGNWLAYFRIQKNTCIIQIYDSKIILEL